jgi:hypothetical protein
MATWGQQVIEQGSSGPSDPEPAPWDQSFAQEPEWDEFDAAQENIDAGGDDRWEE